MYVSLYKDDFFTLERFKYINLNHAAAILKFEVNNFNCFSVNLYIIEHLLHIGMIYLGFNHFVSKTTKPKLRFLIFFKKFDHVAGILNLKIILNHILFNRHLIEYLFHICMFLNFEKKNYPL